MYQHKSAEKKYFEGYTITRNGEMKKKSEEKGKD